MGIPDLHRQLFIELGLDLVTDLTVDENLLRSLTKNKLASDFQATKYKNKYHDSEDRAANLIDDLMKRDENMLKQFIKSLRETEQDPVADMIEKKAKELKIPKNEYKATEEAETEAASTEIQTTQEEVPVGKSSATEEAETEATSKKRKRTQEDVPVGKVSATEEAETEATSTKRQRTQEEVPVGKASDLEAISTDVLVTEEGIIIDADGIKMEIPKGAVDKDTRVSIYRRSTADLQAILADMIWGGYVQLGDYTWVLLPHGLQLLQPVRISIQPPVENASSFALYHRCDSEAQWEELTDEQHLTKEKDGKLSFQCSSFSETQPVAFFKSIERFLKDCPLTISLFKQIYDVMPFKAVLPLFKNLLNRKCASPFFRAKFDLKRKLCTVLLIQDENKEVKYGSKKLPHKTWDILNVPSAFSIAHGEEIGICIGDGKKIEMPAQYFSYDLCKDSGQFIDFNYPTNQNNEPPIIYVMQKDPVHGNMRALVPLVKK